MKLPKIPLAGTLLFSYSVYTTFVPVSIAHSIILFSLAALTAFDQYSKSHKTPSILQEVDALRLELDKRLKEQKEAYEAQLQEVKNDQQRMHIERANAASSSSSKKTPIQF